MIKICTKCSTQHQESDYHKSKKGKLGLSSWCKNCCKDYRIKNKSKSKKYSKEYRAANQTDLHNKGLLSKYEISSKQYKNILEAQNGLCAICKKPESAQLHGKIKKLSVDHCHATSAVRGLLCAKCNTGLGNFKDSIKNLSRAIQYLIKADDDGT